MIYITGDTHKSIDIEKLTVRNFPEQKGMTKDDYVIICGDFGCVWDDSKDDMYWRNWFNDKSFTTLFVDGNHENHKLLSEFPTIEMFGGTVHQIMPSVFHLMRGEIYTIDGKRFFCMGGALSKDKYYRVKDVSWWEEEIPSFAEMEKAVANLMAADWKIDYVISHCASKRIQREIAEWFENDGATSFLQFVDDNCEFKHWFFGHYHVDKQIGRRHTAVFDKIIKLE